MRRYFNSINGRLFFSFGILVLNIIVITSLALYFLFRTNSISSIHQRIDNQRILIIHLIKTDLDFLRFETVNTDYFLTGESVLLRERDSLMAEIRNGNRALKADMLSHEFITDYQFNNIDSNLARYNGTFDILTKKINERGFKDFGVEGEMRDYAHELEDKGREISLADLLMLRRHEKDFILRREEAYIHKFNTLANRLIGFLHSKSFAGSADILFNYKVQFNRLARLNHEIGITPTSGLLGELNGHAEAMSRRLKLLTVLSNARKEKMIRDTGVLFLGVSVGLIVGSLALTYYTSSRLARPIKKLSNSMGKFIVNEGLNEREFENGEATDEISHLSQSFIKLSRKLRTQFNEILHQNRELKKLNAELDRFIYSAAHDLKSPLASLEGLVRLAEREIDSKPHTHYFQMMTTTVKKLDSFIRDITDYAKNKRQQLQIEPVDVNAIVHGILETLQFLPGASTLQLHVAIEQKPFVTDRTRLEIVLKNLISNALRYSDPGKPNPFVRIEGRVTEKHLYLQISDNGIGIAKQHMHRIFDMFYRAVEHSQGTGIGLFLVKESVKMLRGKISVKSSFAEWTVFSLKLPDLQAASLNTPETDAVVPEESLVE